MLGSRLGAAAVWKLPYAELYLYIYTHIYTHVYIYMCVCIYRWYMVFETSFHFIHFIFHKLLNPNLAGAWL